MGTNIIDAFNALSPTEDKGDIAVNTGANVVRQPVGADGEILIADSTTATGVRWGPRVPVDIGCFLYLTSNVSIAPNSVSTVLPFNAVDYDTAAMTDLGVEPTRITFSSAGKYLVGASVCFQPNSFGVRALFISLNGRTVDFAEQSIRARPQCRCLSTSVVQAFSPGDFVECFVFHDLAGQSLDVVALSKMSAFWAQRLA